MARFFIFVNLIIILNLTAHVASYRPVYNENGSADNNCCGAEEEQEKCPENEEFSNCTQNVCRELTCKQRGQLLACTTAGEVKPGSCKKGCVCMSGYLRTAKGKCVPQDQCYGNLICNDDEVVDTCPNYGFDDSCPRSQKEAEVPPKTVSGPCKKPVCTCRINYMRARNGTCIPTRNCPPFKCSGENEEFNACPPICPSGDCSQATLTGRCPLPGRIGILLICRPSCRCKSGYFKNNGVCVPYAECPGKCPENEEFSSCAQGICRAENCTQLGQPIACPLIAEGFCEERCVCIQGTLRNGNGNCVPEDQCPTPKCDVNEEFNRCPGGCDPVNCPTSYQAEQDYLGECFSPAVCGPSECTCRKDHRRDENGECIYIGDCPGICPDNEVFSDGTDTPDGMPGCVCQEGTSRDEQGNCTAPTTCCDNEEFNTCPGGCDTEYCPASYEAEQEYLAKCISTFQCRTPRCTCLEKYRRDENGDCIYIGDCPGICPENEVFSDGTDTPDGMPGCVCQEGTSRDEQGNCTVSICGENEEFNTCPGGCDTEECPTSYAEEQEYFASCISTLQCRTPRCTCLKNYRRDCNGDCIYIGDCPGICPENEVFSDGTDTPDGMPGCVCQEGTSRDEQGNCTVSICGENEEFNTCPGGCDTEECPASYAEEQAYQANCISTLQCRTPRCTCLKNYRRDCNGDCIYIGDCPDICPENEVFSDGTDSEDGEPGCVCQEGTFRDAQGNCTGTYCHTNNTICK